MRSCTWILGAGMAVALAAIAPRTASAECLEAGWRDASGNWVYYHAYVTEQNERAGRVRIRYDYHGGELSLKVRERETPSGRDKIVLRGRWFERGGRSGRVRLEMFKGRHRARGWYTIGDRESGRRYDFALRECRGSHSPPPPPRARFSSGDAVSVLWKGRWYNAHVVRSDGNRFRIHYDGWSSSWDEWVGPPRIRRR